MTKSKPKGREIPPSGWDSVLFTVVSITPTQTSATSGGGDTEWRVTRPGDPSRLSTEGESTWALSALLLSNPWRLG